MQTIPDTRADAHSTNPSAEEGVAKTRSSRWIALGAALAAAVVALVGLALPYRPIPVPGPDVTPAPLGLPEPLSGLKLHVFNTGANRMSSLLVGPAPPWRAVPAFVVEHPTHGLIVFDLGLSHEVAEHGEDALPAPMGWLMESRGRVGWTLEKQMAEAGLAIRAVEHVVISHLHEDHTGVASEFAHAAFLAGPETRSRMIEGSHSPFAPDAIPEWREIPFENEGEPIGPFDSSIDLFGDGSIRLIAGGGHTPEGVMMLVNLESGPVLLTGDAVVHHDWLASDDVERIASDRLRAATLRNQVRTLQASGAALVIPGHDLRHLGPARPELILHAPERFAPTAWPIDG
ncbi:MAG: MBL fold metallo-hydrolase [Deltaproteobacteria bacterium]|nr:MBL fold metallo-hydrolase [Deltaproteobacteria bacterium]